MIARRRFLARQHDVAPGGWRRRDGSALAAQPRAGFGPTQRASTLERRRHVEPERIGLAGRDPALALRAGMGVRSARIERRAIRIARPRPFRFALRDQGGNLGAAFEARIDEALSLEPRERRSIVIEMVALAAHRLLPGDAEPGEIFVDCGLVFGAAARAVDVLDAQE